MTENKNNDKDKGIFRDYENCDPKVKELYKIQREKQTLPYAMRMIKKYCQFKNNCQFLRKACRFSITEKSACGKPVQS